MKYSSFKGGHGREMAHTILKLFLKKLLTSKDMIALGGNIKDQLDMQGKAIEGVLIDKIKSDMFNCVVSFEQDLEPDLARKIYDLYQHYQLPFAFWLPKNNQNEQILKKIGLIHDELNIGMRKKLQLDEFPSVQTHSDYEIQRCKYSGQLYNFVDVIASIMESPEKEEIMTFYTSVADSKFPLQTSPVKFYVGYYQGEPVSTGSLCIDGDSCGIYDLATKKPYRKLGLATEIMKYMLIEAVHCGVLFAYLQASQDGVNIYKKLGFEQICQINTYSA